MGYVSLTWSGRRAYYGRIPVGESGMEVGFLGFGNRGKPVFPQWLTFPIRTEALSPLGYRCYDCLLLLRPRDLFSGNLII